MDVQTFLTLIVFDSIAHEVAENELYVFDEALYFLVNFVIILLICYLFSGMSIVIN